MTNTNKRSIGIIATIASASLFGCMPLFVKIVSACGPNSIMVTFLRYFLALPAIYLFLKCKHISLAITKEEFKKLLIISLVGYGSTPVLLFTSYSYIPSGMATTIHFCYPAFTILGCILFLKQRPKPDKIFAVLLCMAGVILFYNGSGSGSNALLGMSIAFLSGITYSFYVISLESSGLQQMPAFKTIFYMQLFSSIALGLIALFTNSFTLSLTSEAWGVMIFMAIALSFIGVYGFQIGVKYLGPSSATILSTFEPITSLIIGVLLLNESLYPKNILGCAAILFATIIIGKSKD